MDQIIVEAHPAKPAAKTPPAACVWPAPFRLSCTAERADRKRSGEYQASVGDSALGLRTQHHS